MKNISSYIENINNCNSDIRKKAILDLLYIVCMRHYDEIDESIISNGIKNVYNSLDNESKTAAFGILNRFSTEMEMYDLAKNELGSVYKDFKTAHAYMLKLLECIEQVEQGDISCLGDTFSIEKQFASAYQWLKKNKPTSLD